MLKRAPVESWATYRIAEIQNLYRMAEEISPYAGLNGVRIKLT